MSLLARMLSTVSSIPNNTLDSNLEDQFTYNLLFPGPEALCHKDQIFQLTSDAENAAFASKFDIDTKVSIELCDVRVIIMQDVTPQSGSPYLLYDSHRPSPSGAEDQENNNSVKKGERRFQSRKNSNYMETDVQRTSREYQEEMTMFSNCIFGNSEILAHKGTGTKVHILPLENSATNTSRSYAGDGSSFSRNLSARDSKLAKSLSSEPAQTQSSFRLCAPITTSKKSHGRKRILVTRMFPVPITSDDLVESKKKNKISQPKQTKTPMYAVGLVINSPLSTASHMAHNLGSSYQTPGSLIDRETLSSYNSTQWSSLAMSGYGHDMESTDSMNFKEPGSQIDVIALHWDVITRTLTHLQAVTKKILSPMLGREFLCSVDPQRRLMSENSIKCPTIEKNTAKSLKPLEMPRASVKMVKLAANCLMQVEKMCSTVEESRRRIVTGLGARQVVTGQERWGIWRDQARAVCRWSDRKDQDFLHYLLTAFLGNHTDWLQVMAPVWYRQHYYQQQTKRQDEDAQVRSRTIIVSNDKVLARRLIFLLSSFLHPDQQIDPNALFRPGTSISSGAYSLSPSNSSAAFLRENSTRQANKKVIGHESTMKTRSPSKQEEFGYHISAPNKSANLPIPGSNIISRKSSIATVTTATPITSLPYFSTGSSSIESKSILQSTKGVSSATDDLIRLNRSHHLVEPRRQKKYSGWGDIISDIWNNSRSRPSFRSKVAMNTSSNNSSPKKHNPHECSDTLNPELKMKNKNEETGSVAITDSNLHPAQRKPDPSGAYESPVKTSINRNDGIIDIDVALPEYLHLSNNFGSPLNSGDPSSLEFGSSSQLFVNSFPERSFSENRVNVGGWLPQYSPDFTLQAVPGYDGIIEEIKASLQAEITPSVSYHNSDKWIDISSAIIADTRNSTVKRILYRRSACPQEAYYNAPVYPHGSLNRNSNETAQKTHPLNDQVNGCFFEETISSMDENFANVVKKIIAPNGHTENFTSENLPRLNMHAKSSVDLGNSASKHPNPTKSNYAVPRDKCKRTVLGALEEIIKDTVECRGSVHKKGEEDNYLRIGVKKWLSSVENAAL